MKTNFKEKLLSILVLVLLGNTCLFAQNKVQGLILDATQQQLPNMPVLLVSSKDSLSFQYVITDSLGKFNFQVKESGTYFIRVKIIGFKVYNSQPIQLDVATGRSLELPVITMQDDLTLLNEVVILSKKPLFTQKTDRLVFNVENSLASQGGDAVDALKNTPLLKIDETSVAMIGKSGLNVLVNGRPVALKGEALIAYLSTISSGNISKIEIITTPPAKYAAEGNSGLINIVLKKNPNLGWNGTLNSSATQRSYFSARNSANLNYQTEKWSLTSNLLHNSNKIEAYERDQSRFSDGFSSNNRQDKVTLSKAFAPSIDLNYKFNPKTDVSLVYEYNGSDFSSDDQSKSLFYEHTILRNELLNKGYGTNGSDFHRLHGFLTRELDTLGKSVDFGVQWLNNEIENERNNQINNNDEYSATRNFSLNKYRLAVSNLDFNLPFHKISFQTGAGYTFLDNKSDVRFFDLIDHRPELNPALTNAYNYKEHIWSLYVSSELKLGNKWALKAGLRYENTAYTGKSEGDSKGINRNYTNFFPTFYVNYKGSENSDYSFKYAKRVNRPKLEQLNPFQWFINPFQYVQGNPLLLPSFSDNFEFTYSNNSNLSATLYHSITKGQVSYIVQFLEEGKIQRYSYYNLLDVYQYGIYANYSLTAVKNLESQFSGSLYRQRTKSKDASLLPSTNGSGANLSVNNTFKFGTRSSAQLNYAHNFPSFADGLNTNAFGFLTLGYKTSFFARQLGVGITASTIISKGNEIAYRQERSNAYLNGQNEYDYRSIRLNLTYKFGNINVKGNKQKSEAADATRIK